MATTSVFAFTPGTDLPNTLNTSTPNQPANNGGTLNCPNTGTGTAACSITPGQSATYVANYTYGSAAAGVNPFGNGGFTSTASAISGASNVGTMYQQWRLDQSPSYWFYVYARNMNSSAASSSGAPNWAFYYYTKARGATLFSSGTATGSSPAGTTMTTAGGGTACGTGANGGTICSGGNIAAPSSFVPGTTVGRVWMDSGATFPAMSITTATATVQGACASAGNAQGVAQTSTAATCNASLSVTSRWGVAQEAFPAAAANGGTLTSSTLSLLQAIETLPQGSANIVFYDAWEPPFLTAGSQLTLSDTTSPSNSSVTNAFGTKTVGTTYQFVQTIADADGDLQNGSLVFMITTGTDAGQWFQIGVFLGDNNDNSLNGTNTNVFYQSSLEPRTTTPTTGLLTGLRYISTATATVAVTSSTGNTDAVSAAISYNVQFSSNSRGLVSVFGRAEDVHTRTSGNVQFGQITIS